MEKIADNYYRFKEFEHPSMGVTAVLTIDKIDGEELDTQVSIDGGFTVAGSERKEFIARLGDLINEYRI